jgi:hypothetical protein
MSDELNLNDVTEDIEPQLDDEVEETEVEEEEEEEEAKSGNPALSELYDVLPKSLHGMVEPVLNKWQAGIDQEFEKFGPYRKFADAGVRPDVIEASMDLARQVASNPKAVYDELAERYGWQQASAMVNQAIQNTEDAVDEAGDLDLFGDDESNAELKAIKAELEGLKGYIATQQETAQQEQMGAEIEESLGFLKREYGDFDDEAVVRRAMLLADDYPDADLSQLIGAAFEQYNEEVDKMRASVKRAPRVAGGNANKSPAVPPKQLSSREDRIAAIEDIVKRTLATS